MKRLNKETKQQVMELDTTMDITKLNAIAECLSLQLYREYYIFGRRMNDKRMNEIVTLFNMTITCMKIVTKSMRREAKEKATLHDDNCHWFSKQYGWTTAESFIV